MIELPDVHRVENAGKRLNLKHFFPPTMTPAARRRLRECLKKAVLTHQIVGESIPSLITDHYRCNAILFLDLELSDIRHKDFVSTTVQPLLKELAVLHCYDASGVQHALSFAHKRLSQTDAAEIVLEDHYCTESHADLREFTALRLDALLNRNNKRDLYLEAMAKAFLIDHPKVFIGAEALLAAPLWYHGDSIARLFTQLTGIHHLKQVKERLKLQAEKAAANKQIKEAIETLKATSLSHS